MSITDLGIGESDFIDNAYDDLGQTVTRTPMVKTISNETGSPTFTAGTDEEIKIIFTHRSQNYDWAKEGLFEGGDGFAQFDKDQQMNKDDIITVDNEKFRVDNIITRQASGVKLFKSANLFKVE